MFIIGIMIFFVTLICFFNIEYINVYLGTSQNEIIDENLSSFDLTFIFSERDITKCYENNYNECFINLYIDEFKNNETVENITSIDFNNNYYKVDELSYKMSFIFNKNDLNKNIQYLHINKTGTLNINKVEVEYIGFNRDTFSFSNILGMFLLFFCLIGILIMYYSCENI